MPERLDFEYIRKKVSIVAVARELGLRGTGLKAHCWRIESHRNGDGDPSIGFMKAKNRGRCFVCDPHTWSNIDLVMIYLECDLQTAAAWIAERFPVPDLPKGCHVRKREGWYPRFRSSVFQDVITNLVRSGLWRDLSQSERSILPVLVTFTDSDRRVAEISYRGLMRYSGVGSQATIAKAIHHFEQMHLLRVIRAPGGLRLRGVSQYCLTLDDPEFQTMVMNVFQRQRTEIELERQLQAGARRIRSKNNALV